MNISEKTRLRLRTLFAETDREEEALRASMTTDEYRRHVAARDIAYCRERLDPNFDLFVTFPHLRPDDKLKDAYRARIRDLEHFLATATTSMRTISKRDRRDPETKNAPQASLQGVHPIPKERRGRRSNKGR